MKQGRASALLPILVFLVVFIGAGIVFNDFYAMQAIVGFVIALIVAFLQNPKRSFEEKLQTVAKGMGDSNIMVMCLIFVLAGAFSGAVKAAEVYAGSLPSAFIPEQFENPDNGKAHYRTTGPEIYRQLDGKIDVFVAAFGTGGTLTGTGRYLRERIPSIRVVGLEPLSSPFVTQGKKGAHKIQGIGAGFKPGVLDLSVVDDVLTVSDEDAYSFTRLLCQEEGLFCGISSGCNLFGAVQEAKREENAGKTIVTILPDDGERYLSVEGLYD